VNLYNKLQKSFPIIAHGPGPQGKKPIQQIAEEVLNEKNLPIFEMPKDLTIITWNNSNNKGMLEKNLDLLGLDYAVLKKTNWKNIDKIHLVAKFLCEVKTKYVMGLDAFDVVVLGNLREALRIFKSQDCKMLFNAAFYSYPNIINFKKDEKETFKGGAFKYLNAGAWIGETEFCKSFFNKVSDNTVSRKKEMMLKCANFPRDIVSAISWSEQFHIRHELSNFKEIGIDVNCLIFQIVHSNIMKYLENRDHRQFHYHKEISLL
jgi:hypothetical protein